MFISMISCYSVFLVVELTIFQSKIFFGWIFSLFLHAFLQPHTHRRQHAVSFYSFHSFHSFPEKNWSEYSKKQKQEEKKRTQSSYKKQTKRNDKHRAFVCGWTCMNLRLNSGTCIWENREKNDTRTHMAGLARRIYSIERIEYISYRLVVADENCVTW